MRTQARLNGSQYLSRGKYSNLFQPLERVMTARKLNSEKVDIWGFLSNVAQKSQYFTISENLYFAKCIHIYSRCAAG